jgi:hypothetical protein
VALDLASHRVGVREHVNGHGLDGLPEHQRRQNDQRHGYHGAAHLPGSWSQFDNSISSGKSFRMTWHRSVSAFVSNVSISPCWCGGSAANKGDDAKSAAISMMVLVKAGLL